MLAELAAINSAYQVVRNLVSNGNELSGCIGQISKWAGLVEQAESRHRNERSRKGAMGELEEALDTWQTVKRIREQEEELRNMIIATTGNINAWNDIVSIRTRLRKEKANRLKKQQARRKKIQENIAIGTLIFIVAGSVVGAVVVSLLLMGF